MKTQLWKSLTVGTLWVGALLFLVFFHSDIASYAIRTIPYSFLLLAPFGWDEFVGLGMALAVSFWAAHALGLDKPSVRYVIKWLVAVVCGILLAHAALVVFIVARGGL